MWIEEEYFTVKVSKSQLDKIISETRYDDEETGCEVLPSVSFKVQAILSVSFEFDSERNVKIQGDEASIRVECKGDIKVDNETLAAIFLDQHGDYEKIKEQ